MSSLRRRAYFLARLADMVRSERGSVAIVFALSITVLCGLCAFGMDYARALAVRSRLQAAIDAAVLAADPTASATLTDVTTNVNANFTYNMPPQYGAIHIAVAAPVAITNGFRVSASADVPTSFGRLLGIPNIAVNAVAEAVRGRTNVEIVLVLDNTGSMAGSKLEALQTAAKKLVADVTAASTPGTVKFGMVPFSNYVNVGMKYRNASWMAVPNNWTENVSSCWTTTDWDGCPTTTQTGTCYNDGVPYACSWQQCTNPGPPRQQCWSGQNNHAWNGCAGSRTPAPDLTVTASGSAPVPGILDVGCPSALSRLSTDAAAVNNQIDAMIAQGETYIPSGLTWGWRVIAPDSPFADGAPYTGTPLTKKIMVLMTDGENTKSQSGTAHEGWDQSAANQATSDLCTAIKAKNIELYTIAYEVTAAAPKALLQNCATPGRYFFDAQDSVALSDAFSQIAGSLVKLALSK